MNLKARIYENQANLSSSEKSLLSSLLEKPVYYSKMNLKELAQSLYVSESSIFRTCKKLGLSGFSEMRFEMSAMKDTTQANTDFSAELAARCQNTISRFATLNLTNFYLDLQTARTVYIYTTGWQQELLARYLSKELLLAGKQAIMLPSALDELEITSSQLKPDDIFWVISYTGNNDQIYQELKKFNLIKEALRTVSLTKIGSNNIAANVDYSFFFETVNLDKDYESEQLAKLCFSPAYVLIDLIINGYFAWQKRKG